jgi:hypothetical protein
MSKRKKKRAIRDLDNPGNLEQPSPESPRQPQSPANANKPRPTSARRVPTGGTESQTASVQIQDGEKQRSPNYLVRWWQALDQFWFANRSPAMLGLIRLLTGLIALYSLAVWTLELSTFFGADGLLPISYRNELGAIGAWSHLDWVADSSTNLMIVHIVGMLIVLAFAAGVWTRVTAVLTAAIIVSYGNRSMGAGFGLDQILTFLCLYCVIGNAGGAFSIDRLLALRRDESTMPQAGKDTNIAVRLIQIHMCVVYFFAAIGKLQGSTWWTGEAVWLSMSSYEYQQFDMTWLANYLPLVSAMTLVSLFWELLYPALIWPRLTRPIMIALAVPLHLGIGICMGMMEFGLVMLVGNLAFVDFFAWRRRRE